MCCTLKEGVQEKLSPGLEEVRGWVLVNKLRVFPVKAKVLFVGPDLALGSGPHLMPNGIPLPQKDQI